MENEITYIKLDDIIPNRFQPREVFNEEALEKLADSIRRHGVIEPILVRPISNKYEIIAGERRYKASVLAGLTKIPAIVKQMDDKESSIVAYIENEHRSNVSAIEEARTIERILKTNNMTQEELAKDLGINQSTIANKLRLLTLPSEIQDSLLHGEISERHARSLLSIKDEKTQIEMLNKIKTQKMTVRELDSEIKNMNNSENINSNLNSGNQDSMFMDSYNKFLNQEELNSIQPLNNETSNNSIPPINNTPVAESANNSFMSFLNNYNEPVPGISPVQIPDGQINIEQPNNDDIISFLNKYDTDNIPQDKTLPENTIPDNQINVEQSNDDIISFLNKYDTDNIPQDNLSVEQDANQISPEQPQQEENSISFMNYLNNYDNNNPLPVMEDNNLNTSGLNMNEYLNEGQQASSSILDNYGNDLNSNVMLNDVIPPITSPMDANSYVEDSSNYVDISKNTVISNVDEIINRLKVVVDDIKSNSQFKIDTDEINYDDIYQITIKIDKRDF